MRTKRIVLHIDVLGDWLILCLVIERERFIEFLTAYPFPILIMSIRDYTRSGRFILGNCANQHSHSAQ